MRKDSYRHYRFIVLATRALSLSAGVLGLILVCGTTITWYWTDYYLQYSEPLMQMTIDEALGFLMIVISLQLEVMRSLAHLYWRKYGETL